MFHKSFIKSVLEHEVLVHSIASSTLYIAVSHLQEELALVRWLNNVILKFYRPGRLDS